VPFEDRKTLLATRTDTSPHTIQQPTSRR
jgi:hypothetical protein